MSRACAAAIEAAEDIRDPLEGIVEKTATDPGAPFAADTLERLAALKKDDRAAFEALRARALPTAIDWSAIDDNALVEAVRAIRVERALNAAAAVELTTI